MLLKVLVAGDRKDGETQWHNASFFCPETKSWHGLVSSVFSIMRVILKFFDPRSLFKPTQEKLKHAQTSWSKAPFTLMIPFVAPENQQTEAPALTPAHVPNAQGVARAEPWSYSLRRQLAQLWTHESLRVFEDRFMQESGGRGVFERFEMFCLNGCGWSSQVAGDKEPAIRVYSCLYIHS